MHKFARGIVYSKRGSLSKFSKMKNSAYLVVYLSLAMACVQSQIPFPKRPLGFVSGGGEPTAPIHLSAFVDLTCPDCKQAWPTVKKVAALYGPSVLQFKVLLFPLPYHTNAFMAAQVCMQLDIDNKMKLYPNRSRSRKKVTGCFALKSIY